MATDSLESIELHLLLEGIYRRYGFDFRQYAHASLRRRIWNAVRAEKLTSISQLQDRVLRDPATMERLLIQLSVTVTSMFRDPTFYQAFRETVIPHLASHPFIRVWHAGCSSGEEVYSMAILLHEAGLYDRARIYATDMNEVVLRRAKEGILSIDCMQEYTQNYQRSGGQAAFSEYYTANYDRAILKQTLKKNVVFAHHNLVCDQSFNEFNAILCRNVMIYFNGELQGRVHKLIFDSLRRYGVLALGQKESLKGTPHEHDYEDLVGKERLYRKLA